MDRVLRVPIGGEFSFQTVLLKLISFSLTVVGCLIWISLSSAQERLPFLLEEAVVTASRTPVTFDQLNRSVLVITREDLAHAPGTTLMEILASATSVDLQTRGAGGVQSDVKIRGGSFEQSLVMIDGVKISDPQTGHHLLNVPLNLDDIERIEILRGQGSRLFGQNAMGGVINIITRRDQTRSFQVKTTGGDFNFWEGSAALTLPLNQTVQRLSLGHSQSGGFKPASDFRQATGSYQLTLPLGSQQVIAQAGYQDKRFGASNFYSDQFDNEWEHTTSTFFSGKTDFELAQAKISPVLFWRKHTDEFILVRDHPGFFQSSHATDHFGLEMQVSREVKWGSAALGGELSRERIHSSSLGDQDRDKSSVFAEYLFKPAPRFNMTLGGCAYKYGARRWNLEPGVDLGVRIRPGLRFYGSFGGAYRVPTFTELYYDSPANVGNPDLEPERAWTMELGSALISAVAQLNLSVFRRLGQDQIDWIRFDRADPWRAANITTLKTTGTEFDLRYYPAQHFSGLPVRVIQLGYTWLESEGDTPDAESKYALNYLRHQIQFKIEHFWWLGFYQTWNLSFKDRVHGDQYLLIDTGLKRDFKQFTWSLNLTNLFDVEYREIGAVEMPGRWFKVSLEYHYPSGR